MTLLTLTTLTLTKLTLLAMVLTTTQSPSRRRGLVCVCDLDEERKPEGGTELLITI